MKICEVSDIENILMIKAEESILQEVVGFLNESIQYWIVDLASIIHISDILFFPNLIIYLKEKTVCQDGKRIPLSNQEFLVLQFLAEHPGWVRTKEEIYNSVCGDEPIGDVDNIVYCIIRGLRKKLETDPHHPKYIQTVRGAGYKFVVPGE